MTFSNETKDLLSKIDELSGRTLHRSMDLGRLIELSNQFSRKDMFDELAFFAKFTIKTFDLMKRIGKDGNGYDKLISEFSSTVQKSQGLIRSIIDGAPHDSTAYFSATYCSVGDMTMNNLIQLFHDLSWYKNYQIDTKQ